MSYNDGIRSENAEQWSVTYSANTLHFIIYSLFNDTVST
jgi:hypothetical protein